MSELTVEVCRTHGSPAAEWGGDPVVPLWCWAFSFGDETVSSDRCDFHTITLRRVPAWLNADLPDPDLTISVPPEFTADWYWLGEATDESG